MKEIVILGGPNGAGKTTAARKLLPKFPNIQEFLNADEFARAISPDNLETAAFGAGRKMLERMRELIASKTSFGIESTLSGKSHVAPSHGVQEGRLANHVAFPVAAFTGGGDQTRSSKGARGRP